MNARTQTLASIIVLAGASVIAGCGINQHSSFQNAFLPPHAHGQPVNLDLDHPPLVEPGVYANDVPGFLLADPQTPQRTRGDVAMEEAARHFAAGKQAYAIGAFASARQEFDLAIDTMLDASDQNPGDRQAYDRRMDEMVDAIHRFDLAALGASDSSEEGRFEKAPLEDILQMTFPVDPKIKGQVREQVAATVSQLPLSVNDAVLGYINYFSNRGHRTITVAMQRSGRYRPMIQRILDEEGVPQELIHLAQAESGFMPRAISSAAAGGMWQFLVWRGAEYGLTRTAYTDDRMDPEKATRAAAHHLHDLYTEFGDWYLAIAAYNCGPQTVQKAVERTGYADFWELRARGALPIETTNYVPIILAMTIMEKNARGVRSGPGADGSAARVRHSGAYRAHQPSVDRRYHRDLGCRVGRVESGIAGQPGAGALRGARSQGHGRPADGSAGSGPRGTSRDVAAAPGGAGRDAGRDRLQIRRLGGKPSGGQQPAGARCRRRRPAGGSGGCQARTGGTARRAQVRGGQPRGCAFRFPHRIHCRLSPRPGWARGGRQATHRRGPRGQEAGRRAGRRACNRCETRCETRAGPGHAAGALRGKIISRNFSIDHRFHYCLFCKKGYSRVGCAQTQEAW